MVALLEVTTPGLAYICLGGFVVTFSMVSLLMREKFYVNEVVLGTAFGVIIGPHVAGIFDPRSWSHETTFITREITRIVLATGLFAIGVELPKSYMARHAKSLTAMVVPTMAIGWGIVSGILYGLFPRLNFFGCLAIAACLTPTDPIICAAIVGGKYAKKHVPMPLRQILSAESAANDGLAFPFLTISLYLLTDPTRREAVTHWVVIGWLYQVIMGTIVGAIMGKCLLFSYLMRFSYNRGFIDRQSYVAQYLALAIFIAGVVSVIGSDDLLAAFAAGSAISWDGHFNDQTEEDSFSSVIDLVLNCACFIYIGAWLPFTSFNLPQLGITPWRLVVLFLSILVLRRIPAVLMLYKWIPEIGSWREALFCGHFGPMGVGAVFILNLALHRLPEPQNPPQSDEETAALFIEPIVSFVVLGSIIIHGLSIPFFSLSKTTITYTRTITNRSTTNKTPEWLAGVQDISALRSNTAVVEEHHATAASSKSNVAGVEVDEKLEISSPNRSIIIETKELASPAPSLVAEKRIAEGPNSNEGPVIEDNIIEVRRKPSNIPVIVSPRTPKDSPGPSRVASPLPTVRFPDTVAQ